MSRNQDFVRLLNKAADSFELMKVEWKPRAYRRAARGIEDCREDLGDIYSREGKKGLRKIPGVGESIADHIAEFLETGKVAKWEKLFSGIPEASIEMMGLKGLGPRKAAIISKELGVKSLDDLKKAIEDGRLRKLPGFGKVSEQNILESMRQYEAGHERMLLGAALPVAESIVSYVSKKAGVRKISYMGSLRRMCETIGDIDILAVSDEPSKVMEVFTTMPEVRKVLGRGAAKSSVVLKAGVQVDLLVVPEASYGAALQYFTGNTDHNVEMRRIAIKKGYKLSEHGLFKGGKIIAGRSEEEVYKKLGLALIPPEMREFRGEIEAARAGKLPELVGPGDIRGDLHVHTKFSDGIESLEKMAGAAAALGYEYMAVTDHSTSARIAHGLDPERLKAQWAEIERVSKKSRVKLIKGAEVDILPDGSLDYPEEVLRKLQLTVCSVHSGFKMPQKEMTGRIMAALENKYLDILAHPTGRVIGKREGYALDLEAVLQAAADNRKVVEIDSQPHRLDLRDIHVLRAREYGLRFSISSDAHSSGQLGYMRFGLGTARRGWLEKKDVVNCLPFSALGSVFLRI